MSGSRATLVYDGECGICRTWIDYWRLLTGDRVDYRPYQEAAADFPDIPVRSFKQAIQLIELDGTVHAGAAASFRVVKYAPGHGAWWWMYKRVPGFAPVSEWAYGFFSRRRGLLSWITSILWGPAPQPERYALVSWVFLRGLGVIYLAAFASLGIQVLGLIGHDGLLPLDEYLPAARDVLGPTAYWQMPTLFWLSASDGVLIAGTILGAAAGVLIAVGIWVRPALIAAYILYLSYIYAGQVFTSYQWDQLLLETGFLAIFLTSGSRIIVWLYRWLFFRYIFLSGAVKMLSGDATWQKLTALNYHFWTQPLPTPLAWYAARLPEWLLASATAATLIVELFLVFLVFLPRRPRAFLAACVLLFQFLIVLTGNYGFFNLLTMLLCIFLFDDQALSTQFPARLVSQVEDRAPVPGRAATIVATVLAVILVPAGLERLWQPFMHSNLPIAGWLTRAITPLQIANHYGPFATTTTTRPQIVVEGSNDGKTWRPYVFRYYPGPVDRRLWWNIPHQPRLDWQMWFAAYGSAPQNPWFGQLARRLLEGSTSVTGLLALDPFPGAPPKYVRAQLYEYRFAAPAEGVPRGQWWSRRPAGLYFPQASLESFSSP